MYNQKLFAIKLQSQKLYSLVLSGVALFLYWAENIPMVSTISATISFLSNLLVDVGMTTTIAVLEKALQKISANISASLGISITKISDLRKIYVDPSHLINLVINISSVKALYKVFSSLTSSMSISPTVTVATLIKLEVYDPELLGTLDPYTLGFMDSVIIT